MSEGVMATAPAVRPARAGWLRQRRTWIGLAVVLLIGAGVGQRMRGVKVPSASARRAPIEQHVVTTGKVLAAARVDVASVVLGLATDVLVREGDHVEPGQVLVQLDDADARAQVAAANAQVAEANARVDQLSRVGALVATETLRQSESSLAKADLDLQRVEKLHQSGSIAPVELDDARRALDLAKSQRDASRIQAAASSPGGADSRLALARLAQAEAQLQSANARLSQTRIVALRKGVVLAREVEPGDVVQPARRLLELALDGDAQLVSTPDERNLSRVQAGQKARASADAYPQETFDATVSYVSPVVDAQRGTVELRFRVASPPAFLRPDMTVSIDMSVARKDSALVVPADAVRGPSSPDPWVLVVVDGRATRRSVKLGLRGAGDVEIEGGLSDGETVLVPTDPITPGQRVRPTPRD